jgi:hypothetical protein
MRSSEGSAVSLDDLDELQVVTKREFRRGYLAQFNGEVTKYRYKKIMTTPDGHVVVCRPAIGHERRKDFLWGLPHALGIFFVVAWPVTFILLFCAVAGIDLLFR